MSILKYSNYKTSGLPLLGDVPVHWQKTALKYLGDYQNGYPFKPEDWGDEGLPIVRIAQLSGQGDPNFFAGDLEDRVRVNDGDLLFSWSATIDSFIWSGGPAWLNQHIFKVTPSAEADKRFLFYVIKHAAPKLADFDAHGSTMRHIKKESLGERLFVPEVAEQVAIATFLDRETAKIDALVEEQRRLIELLKEKRQAVISQAVTKGLDPIVPMKDSGAEWLGKVPAHWQVQRIKYVARLESGHTPSKQVAKYWENCKIPWVSLNDSRQLANADYITETAFQISELGLANSSARMLPPGAVVFTRDATIGLAAITTRPMAVSQHLIAWCPSERIDALYLLRVFNVMKSWLDAATFGATIKTIGMADIKKLVTPVPPISEQRAIAKLIDEQKARFGALIDAAEYSVSLLAEHRSALISAAVTGKIDVRSLVPHSESIAA